MPGTGNDTPLVSVCCLAYNHEPYIKDCLDGFVMQQTSFGIEVLVHDDASTDCTAEIIREYAERFPDIIKPVYQTENQFSTGVKVSSVYNFSRARGKYIALCEGDDYWTDPLKLQKQVDFLESHPDFAICFHPVKIKNEKQGVIIDDNITREVPDVTDIRHLAYGNYLHTPSVVFRANKEVFRALASGKIVSIDYVLHMLNARYGKIKKLPDIMAVYRIHFSNLWVNNDSVTMSENIMKYLKSIQNIFSPEINLVLKKRYFRHARHIARHYYKSGKKLKSISYFIRYFKAGLGMLPSVCKQKISSARKRSTGHI